MALLATSMNKLRINIGVWLLLCASCVVLRLYSDSIQVKRQFDDDIRKAYIYLDIIANSRYFKQSLIYSSTGSAQKLLSDYLVTERSGLIAALCVTGADNHVLTYAINERASISYSAVRALLENKKHNESRYAEGKYMIASRPIPLIDNRFAVVVVDTGYLRRVYPLQAVGLEAGNVVAEVDYLRILHDNVQVYVLIGLLFLVLIVGTCLHEEAFSKGMQLHNDAVKHDVVQALTVFRATMSKIKNSTTAGPAQDFQAMVSGLLVHTEVHLDYASRLVSQLGNYNGLLAIRQSETCLTSLFNSFFRESAVIFGSNFRYKIDFAHTQKAYVDPEQMIGVLTNLIKNAVKHGDGRNVSINTADASNFVHINIVNKSRRMSAPMRTILKPYTKGPASSGMGLGLHICKQIIDQHHGQLKIKHANGLFEVSIKLPAFSGTC